MSVRKKSSLRQTKSRLQETQSARISQKNKHAKPANAVIPDLLALKAKMEANLAEINAAIADLSAESGTQNAEREQNAESKQNHSAFCALHSALPAIGPDPLPTPVLGAVLVTGDAITLTWNPNSVANGIQIDYATDPAFSSFQTFTGDAGVSAAGSAKLGGLEPNTTYSLRVRLTGSGAHANSAYSNVMTVTTLPAGSWEPGDSIVNDLQHWLENLQIMMEGFYGTIPQLETTDLNTSDRRRLLGSGVRRYGFIEKVFEVSADYPQFWPPFGDGREEMGEYVREIDVLRNLLIWFRTASRIVQDLLLIAGDRAFRIAGAYYTFARTGARRNNPEAVQVFQMLQLFWRRRRRMTDEPTEHEVERDLRALLRGSKNGEIIVRNESDTIQKGERVIIDNTRKAQSSKFKVQSEGEAE